MPTSRYSSFGYRLLWTLCTLAGVFGTVALLSRLAESSETRGHSFYFDDEEFFNLVLPFRGLIDGLAVAALLVSVGQIIKNRDRIRHSATLYLWMLVLLVYVYHSWFGLWTFAHLGRTWLSSFIVVTRAVITFLAVQLLCPSSEELANPNVTDLPAFYAKVARPFLVLSGVAVSFSIAEFQFLPNRDGTQVAWDDELNVVRAAAVVLLIAAGHLAPVTKRSDAGRVSTIQPLVALFALVLLFVFIARSGQ